MGTRAPRTVVRKAKTVAAEVQAAVQRRVAARVDGFLQVVEVEPPTPEPRAPGRGSEALRDKVARRMKQLHPMD